MRKAIEGLGNATGKTGWRKTYARKWTPPAQVCGAWSRKMSQLEERTKEANAIMADALEAFGSARQIDKCIEELGELATVLMKFRHGEVGADAVIDELADVAITGGTMKLLFDPHAVDERIAVKLARLVRLVADQVAANAEKPKPVKPALRWESFRDDELDLYVNDRREVSVLQPGGHLWCCTAPTIPAWFPTRPQAMRAAEALLGLPEVTLWSPTLPT